MNITEELNQIIIKYQLDRYYPRFQMKLQAEKIIEEIFLGGGIEKTENIVLVGTRAGAVDYTSGLIRKYRQIKSFVITENMADWSVWDELKRADRIYLVSFHEMGKAMKILEEHQIIVENLYDIFGQRELFFEDEFFCLLGNSYEDFDLPVKNALLQRRGSFQLEYFCLNRRYQSSEDLTIKSISLEKMLFLTLYMKNFVEAKKCIEKMRLIGTNDSVEAAWSEIENLLNNIKQKLLRRKQEDVVWFWMDAVSFDEAKEMVYLNEMKEKSLSFQNAFTNMPYTSATLRAIFCQKRYVEDRAYKIKSIDMDSSEMASYLQRKGYRLKVMSKRLTIDTAEVNRPEIYDSVSINLWDVLECLLNADDKYFILVHALIETHSPYLSFKMCALNDRREMSHYGKKELDEQMQFYGSFLGEDAMQIFMSDHGWFSGDFLAHHHIHLDIHHRAIIPQKVEEMFSLLDFYPLICQLMEDKKMNLEALRREYVPIENLDRYNATDIKAMFANRAMDLSFAFGYRGVISKNEIYVRFSIGNEFQHNRENGSWRPLLFLENEIESDKNLEKLRQEAGVYPLEILEEDKFEYSRYSHKLYEVYRIRKKELIDALNTYLSKFLSDYEEESIAIRTGGMHSYCLYAVLADDIKRKIGAFIDYNPQCLCTACGKRIIRGDSMVDEGVRAVILSSYIYRDKLKAEAMHYPAHIKVIDIYEVFEQIGYSFNSEFYGAMGLREKDYDAVYKP